MPCRNAERGLFPFMVLCALILSSCAPVRRADLIEADLRQSIEDAYQKFSTGQSRCVSGWDADISITWKSSLKDFSFPGYLQALPPSFFKLVVSNPLGQPLKLLTTDGEQYRYIDVADRSGIYGGTRSWAVRYDLPYTVISRSWPDWLQGRPDGGKQRVISEIRHDREDRGVWLTVADVEMETPAQQAIAAPYLDADSPDSDTQKPDMTLPVYEYLLVDAETGVIKEQIVLDERQKPQATIIYNQWENIGQCRYPLDIEITDLPYGGYIHLEFSEIRQTDLTASDFKIAIPPGFTRTMMP